MYYKIMEEVSTSKFVGACVKKKQEQLYQLSHDYLVDNFHKFSETNKLKIALVICGKMVPTQSTVDGNYTVTKMDAVKIESSPLEFNIGNRVTQATQHSN